MGFLFDGYLMETKYAPRRRVAQKDFEGTCNRPLVSYTVKIVGIVEL